MKGLHRPLALLLLLGGGLAPALGACGPSGAGQTAAPRVVVFAAADLRDVLEEFLPLFEGRTGAHVDLVLGSTGNLSVQILNGAPADLFLSAHELFLDRLDDGGRIDPASRRLYARGRLALVWREGAVPPRDLGALSDAASEILALANPDHAPYGVAAREALVSTRLWDRIQPHLVMAENVAQALQFVETGNADLGLVAVGLVRGKRPREHILIADSLHAPLPQAGAVVIDAASPHLARQFLDLMLSPEGLQLLERYGFEAP